MSVITQDALPPHTMRCGGCGAVWEPPKSRGGRWTDSGLERAALDHWRTCPAQQKDPPPRAG